MWRGFYPTNPSLGVVLNVPFPLHHLTRDLASQRGSRVAITEKELENHEQQIANNEAVEQLLRSEFTNEDLYNWMIGQASKVYFQTYKLASDLAK